MRNLIALPLLGLAAIVQSAVISHITLLSGYGDLVLVLLAAWALQSEVDSAWQWAALASLLISFISRLPWPVIVIGYFAVVLFARILRRRVWQAPLLAMFSVTFMATILMHALSYLSLLIAGSSLSIGDVVGVVTLPSLLLNLLFAIPAYTFMRDMSRWVYPDQEAA
jgi:cell shape-determining protein MreD